MIKKVLSYFGKESSSVSHQNPSVIKCPELNTSINVNNTDDPDRAWDQIKVHVNKVPCETLKLDTPIYDNKV
jgi:hypothetical protein